MILDKLIAPVAGILDKFVVDKDLKMKLQHELETALHSANLSRLEAIRWMGLRCGFSLSFYSSATLTVRIRIRRRRAGSS